MTIQPSPRHSLPIGRVLGASSSLLAALAAFMLLGIAVLGPDVLGAQEVGLPGEQLGEQSLRPYWHVFVAYTIVIVMIGGWAFSIARRLRDVEDRLVD